MLKNRTKNGFNRRQGGLTLIEALVVVAIIGILSAIAIPAYQANVVKGTRSVAISGLMDLANRQQQFYLNNKQFTDDLTNLGYPAALVFDMGGNSAVAINSNQTLVASAAADRVYTLRINAAAAATFSVSAVPQLGQADDVECATFTLDHMGMKTESGTGDPIDCW